jgi:hypothetical protein
MPVDLFGLYDYEPPPENDKRMHALTGAAISSTLSDLLPQETAPIVHFLAPRLGAAAVGGLKEAFDAANPAGHTPDWKDAAATALGAAAGYYGDGWSVVPTLSDDYVAVDVLLRF